MTLQRMGLGGRGEERNGMWRTERCMELIGQI